MKKQSRRKRESKRVVPTAKKDEGQSYVRFDPFDGIPRDQLLKGLKELGEQSTASFQSEFGLLTANVLKSDPLSLLSILAHYGMSRYIDDKGDSPKRENWISQHHIELLQAIILVHDFDEYKFEPTFPPIVQEIWNNLLKVSESFQIGRYKDIGSSDDEETKRKRAIQEWLRLHTQCVRNWGYLEKVIEIMNNLIMPLEKDILAMNGVSFPLLFHFASCLIGDIETRSTENFLKMRRAFKAKNLEQLVLYYYLEFPEMKGDESKLMSIFEADQVDLQQAKTMLMSHNELSFSDYFLFDINDVEGFILPGYSSRDLSTSLDVISFSFGSLKSANQEHVFLDNPCWKRPVIKLDSTTYFWPLPMLLFSFCQDIVENVISNDKVLLNKYFDRRAEFLEDRVAAIFKSQFPSCKIFRGSLWQDPASGREYENDLLVLIDCFAVVVEAKSGRVTDPAKRGALPRLERTINDLIESASIQSERFAAMIGSTKNITKFRTINGSENVVDLSKVTNVARLTVLLDDIATIQSRVRELKDSGIIND